jgi:acetyltransferase-like isoleucine patch superfamily enzyme
MPGAKIGKGCIVSAYSMVKGDFPDFSIISGNPAKVIGDTREMDEPYLREHPELIQFYSEWANK